MINVNSYSIFGEREFWMKNLSVNIRQHFSLYPDWEMWIYTDRELDDNGYCRVIKKLTEENLVKTIVVQNERLPHQKRNKCLMMLWRMLPIWSNTDYVFCRDSDSILTPRQLQCVRTFIASGKAVHGINDAPAHNINLMGGMCGFKSNDFRQIINNKNLDQLLRNVHLDWDRHGADQTFLNNNIWPYVCNSALIHSLGGPNCRSDIKVVTNADISDIPEKIREIGDNFTNYIGAVGTMTDHRGSFTHKDIADFYNEFGNKSKCAIITAIENDYGITL